MRRSFVCRLATRAARGLFLLLNQQPAQGAQLVELALLRIHLLVQLGYGVFKAEHLEFNSEKSVFHCEFAPHLVKQENPSVIPRLSARRPPLPHINAAAPT